MTVSPTVPVERFTEPLRACPRCLLDRPLAEYDVYYDRNGVRRVEGYCAACVAENVVASLAVALATHVRSWQPPPEPRDEDYGWIERAKRAASRRVPSVVLDIRPPMPARKPKPILPDRTCPCCGRTLPGTNFARASHKACTECLAAGCYARGRGGFDPLRCRRRGPAHAERDLPVS